jgi:neutral ceramidase
LPARPPALPFLPALLPFLPAGPGAFDFTQSDTNGTAFWRLVRNFITKPTPEQEACHAPKPILLDVGE